MTPLERDLGAVVQTVWPALKSRRHVPGAYSRAQRRDLAAALAWNADRNVVGFGVGPKWTANEPDYARPSLVVFVVKKLARSRVGRKQLVPRRLRAECVERSLTTDVVEVGTLPVLQAPASIRPGSNADHFRLGEGSVTAIVAPRTGPRQPLLLSCCHVLAPTHRVGEPIESPPDPSSITFDNHVADVATFEPLRAGGNLANLMDAALGRPLVRGPGLSNDIAGLGRVTSTSPLRSGELVRNGIRRVVGAGAVTPGVRGDIVAERVVTLLADRSGRVFLFREVVAYRPTPGTQAGDSGMPIMANTPAGLQLVGMHIGAGVIAGTRVGAAFFVAIRPVLDRFRVDLIT